MSQRAIMKKMDNQTTLLIATDFFDEDSEAEYKNEIQALLTYFEVPTNICLWTQSRTQRFAFSLWNVYGNTVRGKIFNI